MAYHSYFANYSSCSFISNNSAKRQSDDPAHYSVVLREASDAAMEDKFQQEGITFASQISSWNQQLSILLNDVQDRISELSNTGQTQHPLTVSAVSQPFTPPEPASACTVMDFAHTASPTSSDVSAGYVSEISQESAPTAKRYHPIKRHRRVPISQRLGPRTLKHPRAVVDTMAPTVRPALIPSVCASDSKHFVRRVYVFGLKKPDNMSMRTYLYKIHGITSIGILFSHHIAFGITEMIVRVNHVWKLTNAFNMTRQIHLKGFDPLNPNEPQHFLLSHEQLDAFPDLYMASVKATFGNPQCVGGALESYASDYAREIGVFI